jgi:CarD family transcriptional regulator
LGSILVAVAVTEGSRERICERSKIMQFSVGDKVVHPHHGPGQVIGVERKQFVDKAHRYYVIKIPMKDLTVYVPRSKLDTVGVRPAMPRAKLSTVLDTLRSQPHQLPADYKKRQEQVWDRMRPGRVLQIAQVLRDLYWHKHRAHLTKKDSDYFDRARQRLAAELALVSDMEFSDAEQLINDHLARAVAAEESSREKAPSI